MAFTFHHTLESRAAVSVVSSLWYHEDIDTLKITNEYAANGVVSPFDVLFCNAQFTKRNQRIALYIKVTDSVSKLFIPESLKRYLLEFVQIIGENLETFIESHYTPPQSIAEKYGPQLFAARLFDIANLWRTVDFDVHTESSVNGTIDVDLRKVLRWNPDGEVDLEQTGEALVQSENDLIKRFRLAFAYCREDEMLRLWPSVQTHFSRPEAWDSNDSHQICALFWWRYFHFFWPNPIMTYLLNLISIETNPGVRLFMEELRGSCSWSMSDQCSPLTLYLATKLHTIQALSNDNLQFPISNRINIACKRFAPIFFKMPASHQVKTLKDFPEDVFKQLLLWRHQTFFMDTVERSWDIFGKFLFHRILLHIESVIKSHGDSDIYRRIYLRYWTSSPTRLRDVERNFYYRHIGSEHTKLRHFALLLFAHSPAAEDTMKRVLFEGRHVLEIATNVCVLDVFRDLVRTCLPPREWERKLELLNNFFAAHPQRHRHASNCRCSFQRA